MHHLGHYAPFPPERPSSEQIDRNPDHPRKVSLILWQPDRPNLSGGPGQRRPNRKAVLKQRLNKTSVRAFRCVAGSRRDPGGPTGTITGAFGTISPHEPVITSKIGRGFHASQKLGFLAPN